ncbi:hypothetical protein BC832DRAFT_612246 [Gaertneriomyces semiglobifer]|nr:hypothetical protein BC832DRAFT_612246 [Gaertneriomyces semiglobifer]
MGGTSTGCVLCAVGWSVYFAYKNPDNEEYYEHHTRYFSKQALLTEHGDLLLGRYGDPGWGDKGCLVHAVPCTPENRDKYLPLGYTRYEDEDDETFYPLQIGKLGGLEECVVEAPLVEDPSCNNEDTFSDDEDTWPVYSLPPAPFLAKVYCAANPTLDFEIFEDGADVGIMMHEYCGERILRQCRKMNLSPRDLFLYLLWELNDAGANLIPGFDYDGADDLAQQEFTIANPSQIGFIADPGAHPELPPLSELPPSELPDTGPSVFGPLPIELVGNICDSLDFEDLYTLCQINVATYSMMLSQPLACVWKSVLERTDWYERRKDGDNEVHGDWYAYTGACRSSVHLWNRLRIYQIITDIVSYALHFTANNEDGKQKAVELLDRLHSVS